MKDLDLYFALEHSYRKVRHSLQLQLEVQESKLTLDQWFVLRKVSENEGISQVSLAESLGKEPPSITRMVDVLFREKLIAREMNQSDRRKYHLVMTELGREVAEKMTEPLKSHMESALEILSDSDQVQLNSILEKINREFGA